MRRTVLVFGDSNTHGTMPMQAAGEMRRHPPGARWTDLLARHLPGWTVIAEGQPGRTTVHDDPMEGPHRNGALVLPALLESHRPLDAVMLMLGTNDLKGRFSVGPADIALGLDRLARIVRASASGPEGAAPRLLLACPPPIRETGCLAAVFAGGAAKSAGLSAAVAALGTRIGVPVLDLGTVLNVSEVDGIHYDAAAQAPLAAAVAAALERECGALAVRS